MDMAWVSWYEALADPDKHPSKFSDPGFPSAMHHWYPRIFHPEVSLGRVYSVQLVKDLICPTPMTADVTLLHQSRLEECRDLGLRGPARKEHLAKELTCLLPDALWCGRSNCQSPQCPLLHSAQCPGLDRKTTQIKVVNLMLVAMSRGIWSS